MVRGVPTKMLWASPFHATMVSHHLLWSRSDALAFRLDDVTAYKRRPFDPESLRADSKPLCWGGDMAGLKDKRGFIDKDRLDLSERKAVEFWMKRWGVTQDQLTAAHRKVGRMTKDIAAELGKRR